MKKIVLLLITLCLSCALFGCDGGSNNSAGAKHDELQKIMEKEFDYRPKEYFKQWTPKVKESNGFFDLLGNFFSFLASIIVYILIFLLIVGIVFLVYQATSQKKIETEAEEETGAESNTIFNHDYQKEINELVQKQNYKGAIRLLYLFVLYHLNEGQLVKWDVSKTPTEYYYELEKPSLKSNFFRLTNAFLQVGYGNAEASAELFAQANEDARAIVKCVTPVTK